MKTTPAYKITLTKAESLRFAKAIASRARPPTKRAIRAMSAHRRQVVLSEA